MCEMKGYLNYVLSFPDKQNKKATLGTVVHKVLELLGRNKMTNDSRKTFDDDELGRISKSATIEDLTQKALAHYENKTGGLVTLDDFDICCEWVNTAISKHNGDMDPRNQNIQNVEEYFDIEIPHEWAKYSYEINGEKIEGQLRIRGTVDVIIDEGNNYFRILDYKGLPIETPIPTLNGWSTMGELKIGDVVFDRFGEQTKVVAKSEQKIKPCYRITFDNNIEVECDNEHYWKLYDDSVVQIKDLKIGDQIDIPKLVDGPYGAENTYLQLYKIVGAKYRTVTKIEEIGEKLTQCISVDSEDSTYLCTEYMIPTHNTGRRYDWGKDKIKTYDDLKNDKQLLFYYYAMRTKYAKEKRDFYVSIFYINDHEIDGKLVKGGIFDLPFDDSDYLKAERMIREEFEKIKNNQDPKVLKEECGHWKCRSLCAYSKIIPEISTTEPACVAIKKQIAKYGMTKVTDKYIDLDKSLSYGSGGGRSEDTDKKDAKK